MNTQVKNAEVIKAWADGKEIQFKQFGGENWVNWPEKPMSTSYVFAPWFCAEPYQWRVKPKTEKRWLNVYEDSVVRHDTREEADAAASHGRIACIEITYEEGQGL